MRMTERHREYCRQEGWCAAHCQIACDREKSGLHERDPPRVLVMREHDKEA